MLGIIFGIIIPKELLDITKVKKISRINEFGKVDFLLHNNAAFLPRHGIDAKEYILPHLINHKANIKALHDLGVSEIIGINSTGSLKKNIGPGQIVIPSDFIMLSPYPSIYSDRPMHITPCLNIFVQGRCIEAALDIGINAVCGGTYWQTIGPRLETKAEINMMSQFADLVGMTMASEAIISSELGLPYASICSVDNYAHGLVTNDLTMEEISMHAKHNSETIGKIITRYMEKWDK